VAASSDDDDVARSEMTQENVRAVKGYNVS